VILDASLGTPLLGFGAAGHVKRTPVIFVHRHTTRRSRRLQSVRPDPGAQHRQDNG
jgi:hypothetical protein